MSFDDRTGGGDILKYLSGTGGNDSRLDENLIRQLAALPLVKVLIIALLIIVVGYIILMMEGRTSVRRNGRGLKNTLRHAQGVRKNDEKIRKANVFIVTITNFIEATPLKASRLKKEYMEYNLNRANVKVPGKSRIMKYEEYEALKTIFKIAWVGVCILVGVFINIPIALFSCVVMIYLVNTVVDMALRMVVTKKDSEIELNFSDFYLMLHYVLITHANRPLVGIIKSYSKITNSSEMHRLVDVCTHYIETYGEYEATKYIAACYKEIPYVGKLMRLIRQANEGGEIDAELNGFRQELLNAKKWAIERRGQKLIARAQFSFNILFLPLAQAVISAMLIYLDDISLAGTII